MGPGGAPHSDRCGGLKYEGGRGPTRTSRQWRFVPSQATFGQRLPKVAVFALPTDAAGTKGDFEGNRQHSSEFWGFHPLKTRELSQIPARWADFGTSPHLEGGAPSRGKLRRRGLRMPLGPQRAKAPRSGYPVKILPIWRRAREYRPDLRSEAVTNPNFRRKGRARRRLGKFPSQSEYRPLLRSEKLG